MTKRAPIFEDADDFIDVKTAKTLFTGADFKNEKEFCDFIELNMKMFCSEILGSELLSFEREYGIAAVEKSYRGLGARRIDFLVKTKCGKRIGIECKSPASVCELSSAIGQCLSYISLFQAIKMPIDRMVLLSSKVDNLLPLIINQFNLPIEFIAVNKKQAIALNTNLIKEN